MRPFLKILGLLILGLFIAKTPAQAIEPEVELPLLARVSVPPWVNKQIGNLVSGQYSHPRAVDWDGDGDTDFVVGHGYSNANPIWVYLKDGTSYNPIRLPDTVTGNWVAPVDWNGDGIVDLVTGTYFGSLRVFLRDANDEFSEINYSSTNIESLITVNYKALSFMDWDGDGDQDFILGRENGGFLLYLRQPSGNFILLSAGHNLSSIDVGTISNPALFDWDGDADLDLISGNGNGQVRLFTNNSNIFTEDLGFGPVQIPLAAHSSPTVFFFNNDDSPDLVVGSYFGQIYNYTNTTNDTFTSMLASGLTSGSTGKQFADLDGDGDLDILSQTYNQIEFYAKHNTLSPYYLQSLGNLGTLAISGAYLGLDVLDWDADGDLDFLRGGSLLSLYLNDGNNFTQESSFQPSFLNCGNTCMPLATDWDADEDLDIIVGENWGGIHLLLNNGSNVFSEDGYVNNNINTINVGPNPAPALYDWDQDGDLDLIIGNVLGTLVLYLNNGNNNFIETPHAQLNGIYVGKFSYPTFADTDGNGVDELYVGNGFGKLYKYVLLYSLPDFLDTTTDDSTDSDDSTEDSSDPTDSSGDPIDLTDPTDSSLPPSSDEAINIGDITFPGDPGDDVTPLPPGEKAESGGGCSCNIKPEAQGSAKQEALLISVTLILIFFLRRKAKKLNSI